MSTTSTCNLFSSLSLLGTNNTTSTAEKKTFSTRVRLLRLEQNTERDRENTLRSTVHKRMSSRSPDVATKTKRKQPNDNEEPSQDEQQRMLSSLTTKRAKHGNDAAEELVQEEDPHDKSLVVYDEKAGALVPPELLQYVCPLTGKLPEKLMQANDGHNYEYDAWEEYCNEQHRGPAKNCPWILSPVTGELSGTGGSVGDPFTSRKISL